jgi:hypothetical protein
MKKLITITLLLFTIISFSQQDYVFGIINAKEKEMKYYEKDSTANAVVLYEEAKTEFFVYNDSWVYIRTKTYRKIKVFNNDGLDQAEVSIELYNGKSSKETVKNIKAVTHNGNKSIYLKKENIYNEVLSDKISSVSFAMPDVQAGSIIEFEYTVESPYYYNFTGWNFQNEIPTIESVFTAEIPGNYVYNRTLFGYEKLVKNESTVKRKCFHIDGIDGIADCEVLVYSMEHVPAFIEEDYMTSSKNYISSIAFELSEYKGFDGRSKKYSKTWESVDRDYKRDKNIGSQLNKNSYFKKTLPESILNESDDLTKAKKIFKRIQNHYTWNKKYRLFSKMSVTKAYENGTGTVGEINMSLINTLNASGINSKMTLLSTRENGFPTKLHPVISDFNYIIAKIVIDDKTYFLDATDKNSPFGVLPFRCLNNDARVMDFKNGSYWEDIVPITNSSKKVQMLLKFNEEGNFEGNVRIIHKGYNAISKRRDLKLLSEEKYKSDLEDLNDFLEIDTYKNINIENNDLPIIEEFKLTVENDNEIANKVFINPFIVFENNENPFKLNSRKYPVNYGYPRKKEYNITIYIPEGYSVESLPKSKVIKLPDNAGHIVYKIETKNSKISLNYSFVINAVQFNSNDYLYLKEFYKQSIIAKQELITLIKN